MTQTALTSITDAAGGVSAQVPGEHGVSRIANLERIARLMDSTETDVLIASTPENVLYLTSFYSLSHWLIANTESYAVAFRSDLANPYLIFPRSDTDLVVESNTHTLPLYPYGDFYVVPGNDSHRLSTVDTHLDETMRNVGHESAASALVASLSDLHTSPRKISIDSRGFSEEAREAVIAFADRMNSTLVDDGSSILIDARMVKTDEEVHRLSYAANVTEEAIQYVLNNIVEGNTEYEAKRLFQEFLVQRDIEPRLTVLGFGSHGAFPNGQPGARKLASGDIIRFDVGGVFKNYWSDLSRVAVFGEPTERIRRYYRALLLGQEAGLAAVRPGATASAVFDAAMHVVRSEGIAEYQRQHVGHGIGLNIYDPPILRHANNTVLEPGMTLCIETPFYEVGFGGLQVEDLVLVTESGSKLVTKTSRELKQIAI